MDARTTNEESDDPPPDSVEEILSETEADESFSGEITELSEDKGIISRLLDDDFDSYTSHSDYTPWFDHEDRYQLPDDFLERNENVNLDYVHYLVQYFLDDSSMFEEEDILNPNVGDEIIDPNKQFYARYNFN